MKFWNSYMAYIRDNPQRYWFKNKIYGWGWTPATREGWLTILLYFVVLTWIMVSFLNHGEPTDKEVYFFLTKVFGLTALLLIVCWKTGEPPKWQWGIPKVQDDPSKH